MGSEDPAILQEQRAGSPGDGQRVKAKKWNMSGIASIWRIFALAMSGMY